MSVGQWTRAVSALHVVAMAIGMLSLAAATPRSMSGQIISRGPTTSSFFGLQATGRRIVYILDRSASMAGSSGTPLAAAKRELLTSLEQLDDIQQFYLIFYNERTQLFTPTGAGRLVFATEENKRSARRFVESIQAAGGTRHSQPLAAALRLAPDVIFMLTDGDGPDDLSAEELASLAESLGHTRCMIVQFAGEEVRSPRLSELARRSGGAYKTITPDRSPQP